MASFDYLVVVDFQVRDPSPYDFPGVDVGDAMCDLAVFVLRFMVLFAFFVSRRAKVLRDGMVSICFHGDWLRSFMLLIWVLNAGHCRGGDHHQDGA
eukprot:3668674-Rhodomonas_salina.2